MLVYLLLINKCIEILNKSFNLFKNVNTFVFYNYNNLKEGRNRFFLLGGV